MKRYEKYKHYWYPHITTLLYMYPDRLENTSKGREAKEEITHAILNVIEKPDGEDIIEAVNLIYFEQKCNLNGVAQRKYVSERTVSRWVNTFVYEVAENMGYLN